MDVAAGGVDLAEPNPIALLCHKLAPLFQQVLVEGGGSYHLCVEQYAALVSVRAIAAGIGREADALNGIQAHLIAHDLSQLAGRELIDEAVPLGILEGHVFHLYKGDAVILLVLIG